MTTERQEGQINEVEAFFTRPAEEIAPQLSSHWINHEKRDELQTGEGKVLGIKTQTGMLRFFRIEDVTVYSSEYTLSRWPGSRGPEINGLQAGEIIAYNSRGTILTFIKTQKMENIQFSHLEEIDRFGIPIKNDDSELKAGGVAKLAGLTHGSRAQLAAFNFRGERGFMLIAQPRQFTEEELRRIEEELLEGVTFSDEEIQRVEKEILDDTREN